MGVETRRGAGRSKKSSPPYFSQEFFIQNHGDITSCIIMVIVIGLMFQVTQPFSHKMIVPQYNMTFENNTALAGQIYYRSGTFDLATILFYTIVCITVHCISQEMVIDKILKRRLLHMGRSRLTLARFNESANLAPFGLYSLAHAFYILHELGFHKDFSMLWVGYPDTHRYVPLNYKLFFILQIAFWLHQFPEVYLQKLKRSEVREHLTYSFLFLIFISAFYFTNFTRLALVLLLLEYASLTALHLTRLVYFSNTKEGSSSGHFYLWNLLFILVRLASMIVSVFVLFYGLRAKETPYIDLEKGNFNTHLIRLNALVFLLTTNLYLMYNFSSFQVSRWTRQSTKQEHQGKNKKQLRAKKESKKIE